MVRYVEVFNASFNYIQNETKYQLNIVINITVYFILMAIIFCWIQFHYELRWTIYFQFQNASWEVPY